jgi:hypothetical protein
MLKRREDVDPISVSRHVRVAGKLDGMRHSNHRLTLILPTGSVVTCWAGKIEDEPLRALWGRNVVVSGVAVFRPSGKVLRIEAEHISPASEADLELWSEVPEPLDAELDVRSLHKAQGPRSGASAVFGQWPGDDSDEEIAAYLEEIS